MCVWVTKSGGGFCKCPRGYTGIECELFIPGSFCSLTNCNNRGVCVPNNDEKSGKCHCEKSYNGEHCERTVATGFCSSNPCLNDGSCMQYVTGVGSCFCTSDFNGQYCENRIEINTGPNFCKPMPCINGGSCMQYANGYGQCYCTENFYGKYCENIKVDVTITTSSTLTTTRMIKFCESNPCINGGSCMQYANGIGSCFCTPSYTGKFCEQKI
jgi:hypothetical protein